MKQPIISSLNPKIWQAWDTLIFNVITLKLKPSFYNRVMVEPDEDSIATIVDPDQTVSLGEVYPGPHPSVSKYSNIMVVKHLRLIMRKPAFCICENKDADQPIIYG